ncbi:hypothetical protein [Salinicola peritrichatus]|uniref:hypothetical protein n=1 Tax=Salinicola peritrichatus TaxID=1267424 RepID=UPI000DA166FB|nr:hypothetical protein [Salinicola peritrichatus]
MSGGGGGDNTVKDTPEQRYLAQVAAEKWNYAQQELAPLEDAYMQDVNQMTGDDRMSYIRGQASQGQMQATSDLLGQGSSQLTQAGIDPSSGRYGAAMSGLALGAAQSGGDTMARGQFSQENEQITGLQNIIAMGQGESTQSQAGLSGVASQAAADARSSAMDSYNRNSANLQLLGTAGGLGASYAMGQGSGLALGGTANPDYVPGQGLQLY